MVWPNSRAFSSAAFAARRASSEVMARIGTFARGSASLAMYTPLLRGLRARLCQVLVVEAVEIEAAHHGRLFDEAQAIRLQLRRVRVAIDDVVAALAMLGIGDDVEPEEDDLFLGE